MGDAMSSDEQQITETIDRLEQRLTATEKQRDAWRAACRYLYEVIGKRSDTGRPLDLISRGDYGCIITLIGKAQSLEEEL